MIMATTTQLVPLTPSPTTEDSSAPSSARKKILILIEHPLKSDEGSLPSAYAIKYQLHLWLMQSGFKLEDCDFSYVVPFAPYKNDSANWYCTKTQAKSNGFIQIGEKYVDPKVAKHIMTIRSDYELIIGLGELALMSIRRDTSIHDWRGSQFFDRDTRCVVTLSPAAASKMFEWTFLIRHDLNRAFNFWANKVEPPAETFLINPTFSQALTYIITTPTAPIGVDIETRFQCITYISIARSPTNAICIPWVQADGATHYWTHDEELALIQQLNCLFLRCRSVGHNFTYDMQYLSRHWGSRFPAWADTMIQWHVLQAGMKKSLAFVSSMLLPYYTYWKGEGANHIPDPSQVPAYQIYNCKDAARTLQAYEIMLGELATANLSTQYEEQQETAYAMFHYMLRGVRQNLDFRKKALGDCINLRYEVEAQLQFYTPALIGDHKLTKGKSTSPWWQSPTQLAKVLYEIYGLPVQKKRGTWQPTTDDKALKELGKIEPLFRPIFQLILEVRSLNVFISTFLGVKLDWDNRMRCSYGVGMAETYRCTSSADAFDFGGNLQNIPSGNEE